MAKENTTIYIILGLLSHGDMSGYDIKKRIDLSINNFWDAGYGQIYPTLKVLEKEELVTKKSDPGAKGPERIVYSMTDKGRDRLVEWLSKREDKEYVKYEILLKLFFGSLLSETDNIKRIEEFKKSKSGYLRSLQFVKQDLARVLEQDKTHYYYYLTALFGEHICKAYIDWADEAVALLRNLKDMPGEQKPG